MNLDKIYKNILFIIKNEKICLIEKKIHEFYMN